MKIHKEGYGSISATFAVLVGLLLILHINIIKFPHWFFISLIIFFIVIQFFVIRFFRFPKRKINYDENAVLSPADGTIVQILEEVETEYFDDKRILISIFMSPMNVHVNTYPIDGKVTYVKYHPGKHLVASLPKASKDNEHCSIVVEHKNKTEILFRQIAGMIARRIVCYSNIEDCAEQGEEMGIIKFGSRVDVFLPLTANVNVKVNEKVKSKITHLAYFA